MKTTTTTTKSTHSENIVTICAWCPGAKHEEKKLRNAGHSVSHGICDECFEKVDAIR